MYSNKKTLTLEEMRIIHTRLTSFILDKMAKFYKPICGYIGRCSSFLRYLKVFDEYIIKMIFTMRSGVWYEKDNKK